MVLDVLEGEKVFAYKEGRKYSSIDIKHGVMEKFNEDTLKVQTTMNNIHLT